MAEVCALRGVTTEWREDGFCGEYSDCMSQVCRIICEIDESLAGSFVVLLCYNAVFRAHVL